MKIHIPLLLLWLPLCFASCTEILSPDISSREITVNSPADSSFVVPGAATFWWEDDTDIEQFEFRITYAATSGANLVLDSTLQENSFTRSMEGDRVYTWQVRGKNEGSVTDWAARTLIVDGTAPDKATATAFDGDTLQANGTGTLRWFSADLPLASATFPVTDTLILFRKNDSTTIGGKWHFPEGNPREFAISAFSPAPMNGPGTYYWKVVSRDRAGNRSSSDHFSFVVQ